MGFTNVAWESRDADQLALDLTTGAGPTSVGQSGAAWVRVGNEIASISGEYDEILEAFKSSFTSHGAEAAAERLDELGDWLRAVAVSAAGNGERAEEVAAAYGTAVTAMPNVADAVRARAVTEVMASLAAYDGALLTGTFAEFDDAADANQRDAAAVMYQYETACEALALPWDQPAVPEVVRPGPSTEMGEAGAGSAGSRSRGAVVAHQPPPLVAAHVPQVRKSRDVETVHGVVGSEPGPGTTTGAGVAGGYGPMSALGRTGLDREHESSNPDESLDGAGEPSAGLSPAADSWLPVANRSDAAFVVSSTSWGAEMVAGDQSGPPVQPDLTDADPAGALEPDRWAGIPVIGADREVAT